MTRNLLPLLFLSLLLVPVGANLVPSAYSPSPGSGPNIYPYYANNDAGVAYNYTGITFVTTILNLTGLYKLNASEGMTVINGIPAQEVAYYIGLGEYYPSIGAVYIQPVIVLVFINTTLNGENVTAWGLKWVVQAWALVNGKLYEELDESGLIACGLGNSVYLNYQFNLTIKAYLNSEGEITGAWVYIANPSGTTIYYSKIVSLTYPIPDKQVFFIVEDPVGENNETVKFPVIPSNNYVFVNATISNSTFTATGGPPFSSGVGFYLVTNASVYPTFGTAYAYWNGQLIPYPYGQGVKYYW